MDKWYTPIRNQYEIELQKSNGKTPNFLRIFCELSRLYKNGIIAKDDLLELALFADIPVLSPAAFCVAAEHFLIKKS